MKNIIKSLLLCVLFAVPALLTSCDSDTDSNPTFTVPSSFVLNTPPIAENNVIDLATSEYLNLTCTQPDYGGFPCAVTYAVQVSIDPEFTSASGENTTADYTELTSKYTTASMDVDASEINSAVVEQYLKDHDDATGVVVPVYVRLRAYVPGGTSSSVENGVVYSNVITLPNVKAQYVAPALTLPTELYVCGSCITENWSTWKKMAPVYGMEGEFYTLVYSDGADHSQFKWGTYAQEWLSYANFATVNDNAGAGVQDADGDNHNIQLTNPGWYVIYITSAINGKHIDYTLNIEKGEAGVVGGTFGDDDWACISMTAPAGNTEWESPAATAAGEMRAYIKVPGRDWWRTEFTIYQGSLYFRTMDIPNNWAENVGADYSVQLSAGQKVKFNFDTNTATVE